MEREKTAPAEDAYLKCTAALALPEEMDDTTPGSSQEDATMYLMDASPDEMQTIGALIEEVQLRDPTLAVGPGPDTPVSPTVGASCLELGDEPMTGIAGGPTVCIEEAPVTDTPASEAVDMAEEIAEHGGEIMRGIYDPENPRVRGTRQTAPPPAVPPV